MIYTADDAAFNLLLSFLNLVISDLSLRLRLFLNRLELLILINHWRWNHRLAHRPIPELLRARDLGHLLLLVHPQLLLPLDSLGVVLWIEHTFDKIGWPLRL